MNNIVPFSRPLDPDVIPPIAWAVAQLIVNNGLTPDDIHHAVVMYGAVMDACDDDE